MFLCFNHSCLLTFCLLAFPVAPIFWSNRKTWLTYFCLCPNILSYSFAKINSLWLNVSQLLSRFSSPSVALPDTASAAAVIYRCSGKLPHFPTLYHSPTKSLLFCLHLTREALRRFNRLQVETPYA